jgi:hypothetical protein
MSEAIRLLPLYVFTALTETTLPFHQKSEANTLYHINTNHTPWMHVFKLSLPCWQDYVLVKVTPAEEEDTTILFIVC